ncbi:MAG: hypothetical protein WA459_00165 [Stellaceae bacterium]
MDWFPWVWFVWMATGLAIECFALTSGVKGRTLSELVWLISYQYPLLPLAFGILMGHFFWQHRSK